MHFQARFWGLIDRLAISVEKINGMKTRQPNETWKLEVNEQLVDASKYFDIWSSKTNTDSCVKEIKTRTRKANSAFKRLGNM